MERKLFFPHTVDEKEKKAFLSVMAAEGCQADAEVGIGAPRILDGSRG
jgi:hypothetical protein